MSSGAWTYVRGARIQVHEARGPMCMRRNGGASLSTPLRVDRGIGGPNTPAGGARFAAREALRRARRPFVSASRAEPTVRVVEGGRGPEAALRRCRLGAAR